MKYPYIAALLVICIGGIGKVSAQTYSAGQAFTVHLNPIQGAFNLAQSLCNMADGSPDLKADYLKSSANAVKPPAEFCALDMRQTIPGQKDRRMDLNKMLSRSALQSKNLAQFEHKIGKAPLSPQTRSAVMDALRRVLPSYQKMYAGQRLDETRAQAKALAGYIASHDTASLIRHFEALYGLPWPHGKPIAVGLSPTAPGQGFTATVHQGFVYSYFPKNFDHYDVYASVMFHELGHSFYNARSPQQNAMWNAAFFGTQWKTRRYAQAWLDEALATATGNGWIYRQLKEQDDPGEWYHNAVIDRYAHAIAPAVYALMDGKRSIMPADLRQMAQRFEEAFPQAFRDPDLLLANATAMLPEKSPQEDVDAIWEQWFTHVKARGFGIAKTDSLDSPDLRDQATVIQMTFSPGAPPSPTWSAKQIKDGRLILSATLRDHATVAKAIPRLIEDIKSGRIEAQL